jgi:hypothetical protein
LIRSTASSCRPGTKKKYQKVRLLGGIEQIERVGWIRPQNLMGWQLDIWLESSLRVVHCIIFINGPQQIKYTDGNSRYLQFTIAVAYSKRKNPVMESERADPSGEQDTRHAFQDRTEMKQLRTEELIVTVIQYENEKVDPYSAFARESGRYSQS